MRGYRVRLTTRFPIAFANRLGGRVVPHDRIAELFQHLLRIVGERNDLQHGPAAVGDDERLARLFDPAEILERPRLELRFGDRIRSGLQVTTRTSPTGRSTPR